MRTIIAVSFVMIPILPIQILSQIPDILKPEQLLGERFTTKSNPDKLIRMTLNPDNLRESKSSTIIKDQALENEFLQV